jgi:hypothetical protein
MKLHVITLLALALASPFVTTLSSAGPAPPLRFQPEANQQPTGRITGTVTNSLGGALVGIRVALESADGSRRDTSTGDDGQYRFENVEPGNYRLRFLMTLPGRPVVQTPE